MTQRKYKNILMIKRKARWLHQYWTQEPEVNTTMCLGKTINLKHHQQWLKMKRKVRQIGFSCGNERAPFFLPMQI